MDNCTECSELEHLEDGLCLPCRESMVIVNFEPQVFNIPPIVITTEAAIVLNTKREMYPEKAPKVEPIVMVTL